MNELTLNSLGSYGTGKTDAVAGTMAKAAPSNRQPFVQSCKQLTSRALYDCMMNAATVNDLPACSAAGR
jgi:hypothetical protein